MQWVAGGGDEMRFPQVEFSSIAAGHDTAGLANQKNAGRHVPGMDVSCPKGIERTAGDVRQFSAAEPDRRTAWQTCAASTKSSRSGESRWTRAGKLTATKRVAQIFTCCSFSAACRCTRRLAPRLRQNIRREADRKSTPASIRAAGNRHGNRVMWIAMDVIRRAIERIDDPGQLVGAVCESRRPLALRQ